MSSLWIEFLSDIRHMKRYFFLSALLFVIAATMGYSYSPLHDNLHLQVEKISTIAQELNEKEHAEHWFFVFIFLNNAIKTVAIVYLGVFFGIFPFFFIMLNGMILGYLYYTIEISGQNAAVIFLKGIAPHGIIEFPVILIAGAYGLRAGLLVLKKIIGRSKGEKDSIVRFFKLTIPLSLTMIGLLVLAALIESYITPLFLT